MDCAIRTVSDVIEWRLNYKAIPGIVVVLHTYGKDMKFNPHLHCLVTEGGFKNNGIWVDMNHFPFLDVEKILAVPVTYQSEGETGGYS